MAARPRAIYPGASTRAHRRDSTARSHAANALFPTERDITSRIAPIPHATHPTRILEAWPEARPLAALISAAPGQGSTRRSRWSILAEPARTVITPALADWTRVEQDLHALEPSFQGVGPGAGWLGADTPYDPDDAPPFISGWIGWISYGLGALLEPAAEPQRRSDWPLMVWHRCDGVLVHDALSGRWHAVGAPGSAPPRLARAHPAPAIDATFVSVTPEHYQARAARAIQYIRAGDVYQVNLAHTIDATLRASPRALSAALLDQSRAWYGAHIEHTDPDGRRRAVCSASPELFLELDPIRGRGEDRRIVTRPMKGTLAGHQDPSALVRSAKDRAELDMIVDLMRNDLGRVCRTGSVRVEERRAIEAHGGLGARAPSDDARRAGVWQGVATVAGRLRPSTSLTDLLRAVFPPGSVTGAPKIRAMQIIEELEDRPRGPYCGCVGYVGDDGRVSLSVAIRTALAEIPPAASAGLVSYSVGAGIVADSDPAREWDETMHKAGVLLGLRSGAQGRPGLIGIVSSGQTAHER